MARSRRASDYGATRYAKSWNDREIAGLAQCGRQPELLPASARLPGGTGNAGSDVSGMPVQAAAGLRWGELASCCRVVLAVRDIQALFEHVLFGLAVRDTGRHGGQLTIAGVMVCVLVIGVLVLGGAVDDWMSWLHVLLARPRAQTRSPHR